MNLSHQSLLSTLREIRNGLSKSRIIAISGAVVAIAAVAYLTLNGAENVNESANIPINEDAEINVVEPQQEETATESQDPQVTDTEKNIQKEIQEKLEDIEEQKEENPDYEPAPREWISSGPFEIDRSKYVLGEKIFVKVGELGPAEKGQIAFLRPLNDTHYSVYFTIPFDGAKKSAFNYYLEPKLTKSQGLCSEEDIVGKWRAVFRGTDYPNIEFEIVNKTIPGTEEHYYQSVC